MQKQLFNALLIGLLAMPAISTRADVIDKGQTTEGKDFWVTFMQADQGSNDLILQLSISAREDCQVTISNPFTSYTETVNVMANNRELVTLYHGDVTAQTARDNMQTTGKVCYAVNSEEVDTCALHITATKNISLFATNYKYATFDATNVLPSPSLLDEYYIQTYTPSDHDGVGDSQGSHFAIIAAEDSTIVDYCPTVMTQAINDSVNAAVNKSQFVPDSLMTDRDRYWLNYTVGDTMQTPMLMQGQVFYVWTGKKDNTPGDLSGTYVKAHNGKRIAVFQGCPHTNIPYQVKQRDHIFSQAMPTKYWGNTFALTASKNRAADIIRVMALNDETTVYINGDSVYTFNFASNPKRFWEFSIGPSGDYAQNGSCMLTTSCPCSAHLFITSQVYKDSKNKNGDPAMMWINPIEQQIDQVTFATYQSLGKDGTGTSRTTYHYCNVVTDQPELMTLDGTSIAANFNIVTSSNDYYYAQLELGSEATSHTLKSNGSKFIAHVYGFTENESYGYSAGGATVRLSQSIYINGEEFSPDKENKLCGIDTVHFACKPDFMPDSVVWHFGDNTPDVKLIEDTTTVVPHYYQNGGTYNASCTIYRSSSNVCVGQSAKSVIPITVIIGRYTFSIGDPDIPCPEGGVQAPGRIPYTSTIDLTGDHVHVGFDAAAQAAGFDSTTIGITPTDFLITIPKEAQTGVPYGITIKIESSCGDTTATMLFSLPVGNDVIDQRYSNVLGILKDHKDLKGMELSDFQWYRKSDSTALAGQVSSNLNMYDLPAELYKNDAFYVCYTINKGKEDQRRSCACAKEFMPDSSEQQFDMNPDAVTVTAYYVYGRDNIFVNADWNGKTDIECYAQWITVSGDIYQDLKFNIPDGGCTIPVPAENGLYLLRVRTDGKNRSFKFFINH